MNFNEYLSKDYKALVEASNKISGNNKLATDLLHYAIEEMSYKKNLQDIVDSGGARFYCIRIMMTQWRSGTGPFYKSYVKPGGTVDITNIDLQEREDNPLDIDRVNDILSQLPWYDATLFRLFSKGSYNFSTLAKETGIPRTSIGLTINRVRRHIKKHL